LSRCDKCEVLNNAIRDAVTPDDLLDAKRAYEVHQKLQRGERLAHQSRKAEAANGNTLLSLGMDATDGLRFPHFARDPKGIQRIPRFDLNSMGTLLFPFFIILP
jgi:hypothetical protein